MELETADERTPMPIEYLQIVSVPVTNQDQAKDFYVHGLGWDLLSDEGYELANGTRLRWLEVRPHGGQTRFKNGTHPKKIAMTAIGMIRAMTVSDM